MATKIQIRRGLSTDWTSVNPLLSQGEMGLETDTNKFKFGDGSTLWNSLPYASTGGGSGSSGTSGSSGVSGSSGSSGTSGKAGSSGTSGVSGNSGSSGSSGTSGANGSSGTSGANGSSGTSGSSGSSGTSGSGTSGVNGSAGSSGTSGISGGGSSRFITTTTILSTGLEHIFYDAFILATYSISSFDATYSISDSVFYNNAMVSIIDKMWVDGVLDIGGELNIGI